MKEIIKGMEFSLKYAMLIIGKRQIVEGIVLPERIRMLGVKETCKYLEADTIKQVEMKEKHLKAYLMKTRKIQNQALQQELA